MSFLVDTDVLSMLERKQVPPKLTGWGRCQSLIIAFFSVRFGCGSLGWVIRGSILCGCGWPHSTFPRQKQGFQISSKKSVDKS
jgi:hypothetical protein